MRYPIVIHKDERSSYGAIVPDLPGCFSGSESLDDIFAAAQEAIACHIEGILMDGEPIPQQRPLAEHQANPDYDGGVWALVDVDLSQLSEKTARLR